MRKALAALAVLATAAAPASSLAAITKKKKHKFTETALGTTIAPAGAQAQVILQTKGSLGPGAATLGVIPGATSGTVSGADYHALGSIKTAIQFKFGTTAPDGSAPVSGTGTITGGTGRYKGAKGKYTFTGVQDKQAVYTITLTGTITY